MKNSLKKLALSLIAILCAAKADDRRIATTEEMAVRAPRVDVQEFCDACPPTFNQDTFPFLVVEDCLSANKIQVAEDIIVGGNIFVCGSIVSTQIEQLFSCCEQLTSRVDFITQEIDDLQNEQLLLELRVDDLESCCATVSNDLIETQSTINQLSQTVQVCCDNASTQVDDLQTEALLLEQRVEELESCCDGLTARVLILESQLAMLLPI